MARGERYLAVPSVLMMLIGVMLVCASGWWSYRESKQQHEDSVRDHVRIVSELMGSAVNSWAETTSTSFRTLVLDLARDPLLDHVRVSVNGGVVASTVLSEIDQSQAVLGSGSGDFYVASNSPEDGTLIEIWGANQSSRGLASIFSPGLIIAGSGLVIMLLVYRNSRQRLGAISAVSGALISYRSGETASESLRVDQALGPVAEAWNEMLGSNDQFRLNQLESEMQRSDLMGTDSGLLATAVGALPIGIVLYGHGSTVRFTNTSAEIMLSRLTSTESESSPAVINNEDAQRALQETLSGRSRTRWSTELKTDGEQGSIFRVTIRPLDVADESFAMMILEDVTKQRLAEDARASFLARATHELRTPLTNIRLYAEQATDENETDPAERNRAINVINQESRRLERLVGDMLRSAEIENGSLAVQINDLRLEAFFKELEHDYRAQAEQKGITLSFVLPPKLPVIMADREKLALAMHNLIGNALKYTSRGGEVEIGFDIDSEGSCRFRIRDNGFGISEDDQARLFDPYFRSSDSRIQHITGSGIGLGLARDVAKLHGGDIDLKSVPDEGSTFTLWFPGEISRKAA